MRDPYEVLGVPSTATDEEVKKAYRPSARPKTAAVIARAATAAPTPPEHMAAIMAPIHCTSGCVPPSTRGI